MQRQRTVGEYRAIDLIMFLLMVVLGEAVIGIAAASFPRELYVFSLVPVITAIVMMRWGPWALLHAAAGGAVYTWVSGGAGMDYIIYCAGNLLGLGALVLFRVFGKEKIRGDALGTMAFGVATALLMQLGRAILWMLIHHTVQGAIVFFTADVLTLLFTAVVMWIVRKLDGVFEDQITYLLRISKEKEEERESSDEG